MCSQVICLGGEKSIDLITSYDVDAGETELANTPSRFHLQEYEMPPHSKVTGQSVQVRANFHNKYLVRSDFRRYQKERRIVQSIDMQKEYFSEGSANYIGGLCIFTSNDIAR